eukprot:2350331-Amphidinium_carterae.2
MHKKRFEFYFGLNRECGDSVLWTDGSNTAEVSSCGYLLESAKGDTLATGGSAWPSSHTSFWPEQM